MNEKSEISETIDSTTQHRSLWGDVWRQFRKHKGAMTGVIVFIFITLLVSIGPLIHDIAPSEINKKKKKGILDQHWHILLVRTILGTILWHKCWREDKFH